MDLKIKTKKNIKSSTTTATKSLTLATQTQYMSMCAQRSGALDLQLERNFYEELKVRYPSNTNNTNIYIYIYTYIFKVIQKNKRQSKS